MPTWTFGTSWVFHTLTTRFKDSDWCSKGSSRSMYLCFPPCAFLYRCPWKCSAGCKGSKTCSENITCSKSNELLVTWKKHWFIWQNGIFFKLVLSWIFFGFWISYLISINNIVMLDRIDFSHREGHSKAHYSYRECIYCSLFHHFRIWSKWSFKSKYKWHINGI